MENNWLQFDAPTDMFTVPLAFLRHCSFSAFSFSCSFHFIDRLDAQAKMPIWRYDDADAVLVDSESDVSSAESEVEIRQLCHAYSFHRFCFQLVHLQHFVPHRSLQP